MLTSGCDGPFFLNLINISAFPTWHYVESTMVQSVSTNPSPLGQIYLILAQTCIAYVYGVLPKLFYK